MNCRDWEERIALYAGGDSAPAEAAEVERHIAECQGCQVLVSGLRESLELLRAGHAEPIEEAHYAAVRARVLGEIQAPAVKWWKVWGAVLATVAVLGVVMVAPHWRRGAPAEKKQELAIVTPTVVPTPPPVTERMAAPPAPDAGLRHRVGAGQETPTGYPDLPHVQKVAAKPGDGETLLIHVVTDDPDIVLYWIAEKKETEINETTDIRAGFDGDAHPGAGGAGPQ